MFWLSLGIYWQHATYWDNVWMVVFWRTPFALACALAIATCVFMPQKGLRLWPVKAGHYLGEISYGIYLWHLPVILLLKQHTALAGVWFLAWAMAIVIMLSAASWHLLEQPCLKLGRSGRFLPRFLRP